MGSFMRVLDSFSHDCAVPSLQADLDSTFGEAQLVIAGYGFAHAVGMIIGGRLGDHFGCRRLFVIGTAAFVVASAACASAWDPFARVDLPGPRSAVCYERTRAVGAGPACGPRGFSRSFWERLCASVPLEE
ncbi:MFS transporter [Nonomuraea ceibae]|uniref:MFS transporter n=1 Tax=Nonomuraea ceibae TaxID=1935170 RepID=UPI0024849966|nr:MFS transporter [Nonomuraea ceibae]